ncbi:histone acetyltransferase type B catalytic subunit-like [Tubulanus polymorphus]|uniref:histone acetyltransferase type B catalytic subunit-like n=1 Tax=Tubulanus polymorphus TaxID=672921 RepID=UPI003DA465A2
MSLLKDKLEQYKCDSNDALVFKLVREQADLENDDISFSPVMSHQVFGENESIFGYRDLQIEMFCTAGSLKTFLNIKYLDKISPKKFDGVHADDVMPLLTEKLPPGYHTNIDEFVKEFEKEKKFRPFGELIHSYTVNEDEIDTRKFEIYKTDVDERGFREFHSHLEPFILFYIDAASYIDTDDPRWNYYLVFEKYKRDGETMYATVGYMTTYRYYAYPEKFRPRISQVLILPPFQKQGHGCQLLQTFYNEMKTRDEILDITVEDPSEDFQRLRDFVDARNCRKLSSFQENRLHEGFTAEMAKQAQTELKINKKQARRVYEILRLQATDEHNEKKFKLYRLDVKKRINQPFQKSRNDMSKYNKVLQENELMAAMNNLTTEQRMNYLQKEFEESVANYQKVIQRLSRES